MRPWPCLCGKQPQLYHGGYFWFECAECGYFTNGETEDEAAKAWNERIKEACPACDGPTSHEGSPRCPQRKSLASGGHVAHCTCDTCF